MNINLENYEVADNMDLYYVLQDFESYFEIRFNKKPKLVKKIGDDDAVKKGIFAKKPPVGVAKKPQLVSEGKSSAKGTEKPAKPGANKLQVKRSQSTAEGGPLLLEGKNIEIPKEEEK